MQKTLSFLAGILLACLSLSAQSIKKTERRAINRTRVTVVSGDSVQQFELLIRQPRARRKHTYHWYAHNRVHRAPGVYNGRLLHGPYLLLNRAQQPLEKGQFKQGRKTGHWAQWRPDGTLLSYSRWRNGRQRGRTELFDAQGQPVKPAEIAAVAAAEESAHRPWLKRLFKRSALPATDAAAQPQEAAQVMPPAAPAKQRETKERPKKNKKNPPASEKQAPQP